jgi:hypothetical protein
MGRPGPRGPRVRYLFPLAISKTGSKPEVGEEGVRTSVARASGLGEVSEPVSDGAVEEAVAQAVARAALSVVQSEAEHPVPERLPAANRGLARATETLADYLQIPGDPPDETRRLALEAATEASTNMRTWRATWASTRSSTRFTPLQSTSWVVQA